MLRLISSLIAALMLGGCGYNDFQRLDEQSKAAWSQVLNQYQRRAILSAKRLRHQRQRLEQGPYLPHAVEPLVSPRYDRSRPRRTLVLLGNRGAGCRVAPGVHTLKRLSGCVRR